MKGSKQEDSGNTPQNVEINGLYGGLHRLPCDVRKAEGWVFRKGSLPFREGTRRRAGWCVLVGSHRCKRDH
jgi:hypothetical protein